MRERINQISKEVGIPTKKVLDFLFVLRSGDPLENNKLLQKIGVSQNSLNQVKKLLSPFLEPSSTNTQLKEASLQDIKSIFTPDYKIEESLWTIIEDKTYKLSFDISKKYFNQKPSPERKYDQFAATTETVARRASLLNFFEDVR